MQCRRCGKELGGSSRCNFCGYDNVEGNVREMTNSERNFYDGVTIDADENSEPNSFKQNPYKHRTTYTTRQNFSRRSFYTSSGHGFLSRIVDKLLFGLANNKLVAKIAVTLISVALAALMFFVAVPILFLILAIGIALLVISKLGR